MNDELLFEAMSGLDDAYIVSAARSLGYYGLDSVPARRPRRALRRTVTAIAAAVMLILAGCLTAMAVSEPVREAVLAFFGVQSEETVPVQDGAQAAMPVRNGGETLSGGIEAAYYSVPNNCEAGAAFSSPATTPGLRAAASSSSWRRNTLPTASPSRARASM